MNYKVWCGFCICSALHGCPFSTCLYQWDMLWATSMEDWYVSCHLHFTTWACVAVAFRFHINIGFLVERLHYFLMLFVFWSILHWTVCCCSSQRPDLLLWHSCWSLAIWFQVIAIGFLSTRFYCRLGVLYLQVGGALGWRAAFWIESLLMLPLAVFGFVTDPIYLKGLYILLLWIKCIDS